MNGPQRDPTGKGMDFLCGAVLQLPKCGCTVEGEGTCGNPVRIIFCQSHQYVEPHCPRCGSAATVVNMDLLWTIKSEDDPGNIDKVTEYQCEACGGTSFWL